MIAVPFLLLKAKERGIVILFLLPFRYLNNMIPPVITGKILSKYNPK